MTRTPKKLKYIADQIARGDAPSYVDESEVLAINQACVSPRGLAIEKAKFHDPDDTMRIGAWLKTGDVLINSTGTGTLGRVGYVDEGFPKNSFADGHVTIIRDSKGRFVPRFLFYLLSIQQEQLTVECAEGATNQIELSRHNLGNKVIEWPSLEEQQRIAAFLDVKVSRLDQLVDGKQRLLDLLTEKRRSLIANAVTRGLNPDVPMRDSGIDWLGHIPAHWDTQRAKVLFREVDDRSTLGDETLLSLRMEKGLVPHNDVSTKLIPTSELIGYKRARVGQIVVNRMRAASGLIAVVPQDGIVSPDYAVFEAIGFVSPEYFALLFQTTLLQAVFRSESKGLGTGQSGFLRLYSENFLALYLPLPPCDEQQTIVVRTQIEVKKLNDFVAATERTITLLNERRTALIARAVNGQE